MNNATEVGNPTDLSVRYLDEVLLRPEQVDDVVLAVAEPAAQDGGQHPHADY